MPKILVDNPVLEFKAPLHIFPSLVQTTLADYQSRTTSLQGWMTCLALLLILVDVDF